MRKNIKQMSLLRNGKNFWFSAKMDIYRKMVYKNLRKIFYEYPKTGALFSYFSFALLNFRHRRNIPQKFRSANKKSTRFRFFLSNICSYAVNSELYYLVRENEKLHEKCSFFAYDVKTMYC